MRGRFVWIAACGLGVLGLLVARSDAQPPGPQSFCDVYPSAPACVSGEVSCSTCHISPPSLNVYGLDVQAALAPGQERPLHVDTFAAELGSALVAVQDDDSDDDGFSNLEEIEGGSAPSDATSVPDDGGCVDAKPDDGWNVCGYDADYAFKRVWLDFCGQSPTLADREAFRGEKDRHQALHDTLDACMQTEAWRGIKGRVWNLGNRKIGPQQAVKTGKNSGPIPLADYDDDYAYFTWTQTGDRDARLVLTGQTFVSARYEDGHTVYQEWDRTPDEDLELRGYDAYQAVRKSKRAGLLTHRWFLMSNTMFTAIPRTTAAQAYRAFLGYDIARQEGLHAVSGEPEDYDSKGVQAEGCAVCHATLDPLSYPFSRYEGIGGGYGDSYSYSANRLDGFVDVDGPRVAETPEQGMLLGQPVADLVEWAQVAADSDAFRRATVRDYWRLLMGEEPRAAEQGEYGALSQAFGDEHGYNVERMLHALIDTEAYGAP